MTLAPRSLAELQEAVAASAPAPLRIRGGGSKRPAGRDATTLDLRQLSGIVSYNAAECVITCLGGTPVRDVQRLLAEHGQYLPFNPPLARAGATIGGTVAAGLSGPGRYRYGGIRDFVIGAAVVDGEGRLVRSGGQVVKNAAGFLLHHALVGSAGRYGAIGELSFKVFPRPEASVTLRVAGTSAHQACQRHQHLRGACADLDALDLDFTSQTIWARIGGAAAGLPTRVARIRAALAGADVEALEGDLDARTWQEASELSWAAPMSPLVKLVGPPSALSALATAVGGLGRMRATCGGAAALVAPTRAIDGLPAGLGEGWRGVVVRGADCGRQLHASARGEAFKDGARLFDERVRRVLDPQARFQ